MKFVIVGTGGTGGVLGAYLAHSGQDVTFIARGEHLRAIQEHGLRLHTEHRGDILVKPAQACTMDDYHGTPDVMLVCVKYYGLDSAIALARRVAGPDTLIIPILNVFGTGAVMQEQLPGLTVLDGCIYVFAKKGGPGLILQPQSILKVYFGFRSEQDQRLAEKARAVEQIMQVADIETHFTNAIQREAITKFSFVSPMGAAGLYFGVKSDAFQVPGEPRTFFQGLVQEVQAIGEAMGLTFTENLVTRSLRMMDGFAPGLTTSMQRDVAAGGTSEFAGLVDRVVALGRQYHVPTPCYDKVAAFGREHHIK